MISMAGKIRRVAGPVVVIEGLKARMFDVVRVGKEQLIGEVIQIHPDSLTVQVYEDTSGLKPGEPVESTGNPLTVELGPGLLTSIYDGIQRPLPELQKEMGDFIKRGAFPPRLDKKKKWTFTPTVKKGDQVSEGQIIGTVQETSTIVHKVLVPPGVSGTVKTIAKGSYTVTQPVATLSSGAKITLMQEWPIRIPRPSAQRLVPNTPLRTGQRVLDALFPVAKGGTAAVPGPFGAGKTVIQQQLAKWSDTEIVVYIGCGERGNEMTEVLTEFPELKDPQSGNPLMDRTVLIANTSNMPVAAREASIYTGITIAEYYRDMGYHVALMADSTSRWAEAMREISSRLEEMPGEEGYPAYLSTKLAEFYERAGKVETFHKNEGSVTIIGAVSPPGGDLSEPVTQATLRVVKTFWSLDAKLAQRRHFPSINWLQSYSLYTQSLADWFSQEVAPDWNEIVTHTMNILQEEEKLQEIVQLVGSDALPEKEKLTLEAARMLREFFLQQNAYHDVDTYADMQKSYRMLKVILAFYEKAQDRLKNGISAQAILGTKGRNGIADAKFEKNYEKVLEDVTKTMNKELDGLK